MTRVAAGGQHQMGRSVALLLQLLDLPVHSPVPFQLLASTAAYNHPRPNDPNNPNRQPNYTQPQQLSDPSRFSDPTPTHSDSACADPGSADWLDTHIIPFQHLLAGRVGSEKSHVTKDSGGGVRWRKKVIDVYDGYDSSIIDDKLNENKPNPPLKHADRKNKNDNTHHYHHHDKIEADKFNKLQIKIKLALQDLVRDRNLEDGLFPRSIIVNFKHPVADNGCVLSVKERISIVKLAQKHNLFIYYYSEHHENDEKYEEYDKFSDPTNGNSSNNGGKKRNSKNWREILQKDHHHESSLEKEHFKKCDEILICTHSLNTAGQARSFWYVYIYIDIYIEREILLLTNPVCVCVYVYVCTG